MQKQKQINLTIYLILTILMILISTMIFNNFKLKNPFEIKQVELTADQKKNQILQQLKDNPIYSYTDGTNWGLKNYKTGQVIVEPQFKSILTFPIAENKNLGMYITPSPYLEILKSNPEKKLFSDELGIIDYKNNKITKYPKSSLITDNKIMQAKGDSYDLLNTDGTKILTSKFPIIKTINDQLLVVVKDGKYQLMNKEGLLLNIVATDNIRSINKSQTVFETTNKYDLKSYQESHKNFERKSYIDEFVSEYSIVDLKGNILFQSTDDAVAKNGYYSFKDIEGNQIVLDENGQEVFKAKDATVTIQNKTILVKLKTDIIPYEQYDNMKYNDPNKDAYESDYQNTAYKVINKLISINNNQINEKIFGIIGTNLSRTKLNEKEPIVDNYKYIVSDKAKPKYLYIINEKYETVFDPVTSGYEITSETINSNRYIEVMDLKTKIYYVFDLQTNKTVLEKTNYKNINYSTDYISADLLKDPKNYYESTPVMFDLEFKPIELPDIQDKGISKYIANKSIIFYSKKENEFTKNSLYDLKTNKLIIETNKKDEEISYIGDDLYLNRIEYNNYTIFDKNGIVILSNLPTIPAIINNEVPYTLFIDNNSGIKYLYNRVGDKYNFYNLEGKLLFENYEFKPDFFDTNYLLTKHNIENKDIVSDCKLITITGNYDCLKQK